MKYFTCQVCGKYEKIAVTTLDKRMKRGTALKCRECLFDRNPSRHYSAEMNDQIWELIRAEFGIEGGSVRNVAF